MIELELEGYCNADYAGDIDRRRSTWLYIHFKLRRHQLVKLTADDRSVSTAEAKYMAAAQAVKQAL